jgi:predicted O-linked N-acetylglucosamine transferase (SPINDLY family)
VYFSAGIASHTYWPPRPSCASGGMLHRRTFMDRKILMPTIPEVFATAVYQHRKGNLEQAELSYRQVLQAEPRNVLALHFLGVLALQVGRHDLAVGYIGDAARLQPDYVEAHNNLGIALAAQGRLDEAVASYREVLRLRPDHPEAHNNLGVTLAAQEKFEQAAASYLRALALKANYAEAYCNLGNVLGKLGRLDEAVTACQKALELRPNDPEAHNNLGNALALQGKLDEAVTSFQKAIRLKPNLAEAHINLGIALATQDRLEDAVASFEQALRIQPNHPMALNNLGAALAKQGKLKEATSFCQQAVRLNPERAGSHYNLAVILLGCGKTDEAVASFQQAVRLQPNYAEAHYELGGALQDQGKLEEAVASLQRALSLKPDCSEGSHEVQLAFAHPGKPDDAGIRSHPELEQKAKDKLRILLATLLPPIYQSTEELHYWRKRLTENIQQLRNDHITLDLSNDRAKALFYLAYQGLNDRDIQREMARVYTAPRETFDEAAAVRNGQDKLRVGFLSCHLKRHTIGHLMRGLIANLSRKEFSVTILFMSRNHDEVAEFIRQHADHAPQIPKDLHNARRLIADLKLDILFYTDIGMDPTTYTLAFSRLAPVQCVTWGHPSTTGIDTIDYFISSEHLESEDGEQHYTEKLVRLKSLPIYYYRPVPPSPLKDRAHFGLSETCHLYGCPQSLFKFHPEFDEILGGILREDPLGNLVLIHGKSRHWDELLMKRFSATIPDVVERIRFVPPQSREGFLNLNSVVDVLLDPVHFGGGNTTYEGLTVGTPVVTLPSRFLRGRITWALYKQIGVLDCVTASPAEYVKLAVKLGTDSDYRASIRSKILAAQESLFENANGVRELEQFFQQAVSRALSR